MAARMTRTVTGTLGDGSPLETLVFDSGTGISARVFTFGATLASLILPDRRGCPADVVLGHDDVQGYIARQSFFGETVGRYANRISGGRFTLDGETFQLPLNDGGNCLHGGGDGFDRRNWTVRSAGEAGSASAVLGLHSPDGDGGFPGAVDATVTYGMDAGGTLTITFEAEVSRPTVLNMTNHALYSLSGEDSPGGAVGHRLTIPAGAFTPVDANLIPTGEIRAVAGTPFDFTAGRILADAVRDGCDEQIRIARGYDHNFAIDAGLTAEPKLVARLEDPASGRVLDVLSTEPGVQIYSGNFLDGTVAGKRGHLYRMGDGIAIEPQKFPDAPNRPEFVSARVDPGTPYRHRMVLRPSVA